MLQILIQFLYRWDENLKNIQNPKPNKEYIKFFYMVNNFIFNPKSRPYHFVKTALPRYKIQFILLYNLEVKAIE